MWTDPRIGMPLEEPSKLVVQSLNRALDILEAFPRFGPEIGLSRLASLLHLNKATTYRLLSNLEERGYIERSAESRDYRLGLRTFELGAYYQSQLKIRRVAVAYMNAMVDQTRESAFLCVREGDEAVCIERVEGDNEVNIFALRVGGKQPLHCGAAPRALLAGASDQDLRDYALRTGLPGYTPFSLTNVDRLIVDVHLTRMQGYAVSLNDASLGIAAVGAPVYDHSGQVAAAISLSGLSSRYGPGQIEKISRVVVAAAERFSRQLGYSQTRTNPGNP
jgi:DNA-binding IclR family transcriptional regulator